MKDINAIPPRNPAQQKAEAVEQKYVNQGADIWRLIIERMLEKNHPNWEKMR